MFLSEYLTKNCELETLERTLEMSHSIGVSEMIISTTEPSRNLTQIHSLTKRIL